MIATNTTTALLVNAEPLSRCSGKGADVVNNGKTTNPIIAHKPVSTTDGKPCQPAKAVKAARKPAAPRKKRYYEDDLVAFAENACMLRGAAEALLDLFHVLYRCDDEQKKVVDGVKDVFREAADLLIDAAGVFEEGISLKILDKRQKTFFSLVQINNEDMGTLAAFSAINSGDFRWNDGGVCINETRFLMVSQLLGDALESAGKCFSLADKATKRPALAAALISMEGGARR